MFQYIEHLDKVEFDEEIVLVISSFLTHGKKVTEVMIRIFICNDAEMDD